MCDIIGCIIIMSDSGYIGGFYMDVTNHAVCIIYYNYDMNQEIALIIILHMIIYMQGYIK